jgi:acetyltransferase-like isoleucine patch superfamily enzyme
MALLDASAIAALGFASVGRNVRLSDKASFYNCANIHIGDHVRIDDFCVLSAGAGGIHIGSYIHIAVFSSLIGAGCIELSDYANISSRVSIYASSDDYSGAHMGNPMVPAALTAVHSAPVHIGKHVIVGAGSVILPGVTLGEGVAVGALSLVRSDCAPFGIYAGVPARRIRERQRGLLLLEAQLEAQLKAQLQAAAAAGTSAGGA